MIDSAEIVWERVCKLKDESGMNIVDLSKESNVPLTSVKRYFSGETKNPGFMSLCSMIVALGASVDEVLEIDPENQPVHLPADDRYSRQLEKDLAYERKHKARWQIMFVVLTAINVALMVFDITNPQIGYVRYQQQMAAFAGQTGAIVLFSLLRHLW